MQHDTPEIGLVRLPGRLPTTVDDIGFWYDDDMATRFSVAAWDVAGAWWSGLFSQNTLVAIRSVNGRLDHTRRSLRLKAQGVDAGAMMRAADQALQNLKNPSFFDNAETYLEQIAHIEAGFQILNTLQDNVIFGINGARVAGLNYGSSVALGAFASGQTLLQKLVENAVEQMPPPNEFLFLKIKDEGELLSALMLTEVVRRRWPNCQMCLGDHGHENYSLHSVLKEQGRAHPLFDMFDDVVVERGAIPVVLKLRFPVCGGVPSKTLGDIYAHDFEIFAPKRILTMRLSEGRCYWAKCTYCTQNAKFGNGRAPSKSDLVQALDRLSGFAQAGVSHFQFSDEALSPALLREFSQKLVTLGIDIHWACRSKLEPVFGKALFDQLALAGCYEVLFGLESTVPRIQIAMDKYDRRLDEPAVAEILNAADQAGIGIHLNLIAGFPSETLAELNQTVDFLIQVGQGKSGFTFLLNEFVLFRDTPMFENPHDFGMELVPVDGDIFPNAPFVVPHPMPDAVTPDDVLREMQRAFERLHWGRLGEFAGGDLAVHLYFTSGHGSVFKSGFNPFDCGDSRAVA